MEDHAHQPQLELSDEVLVARVARGDRQAFSLLYDRYAPAVYTLGVYMLNGIEAEEMVQEVFLRLWNRADQYDPARGSFRAWFMSIGRYHMLDTLKRRSRRERLEATEQIDRLLVEAVDPLAVDVEDMVWLRERGQAILHALNQLPAEQRQAIVLAYFGGLSQSAIAEHLDWPLGTVKKRIRLGLQKLQRFLTGQGLSQELPMEARMDPSPREDSI